MIPTKTLQVSCIQRHWAKPLERNLERTLHYIRAAAAEGSRVAVFPEANLTGYYFPDVIRLEAAAIEAALDRTRAAAAEAGIWKRTSGRAQQPVGPNRRMFHCVANTIGQSPDGRQTSSGQSFIREPNGLPLAEAGWYQEEMITAVLDLERADAGYVLDSLHEPPFLRAHWENVLAAVKSRVDPNPE